MYFLPWVLQYFWMDDSVVTYIKELGSLWTTKITITSGDNLVQTELVSFKGGVFQIVSLSSLLISLSLLPVSISLMNICGCYCCIFADKIHKITRSFLWMVSNFTSVYRAIYINHSGFCRSRNGAQNGIVCTDMTYQEKMWGERASIRWQHP